MLLLLLTVGCQQDLVRVMGTLTGVKVVPHPPSLAVEEAPPTAPSVASATTSPTTPTPAQPAAAGAAPSRPGTGSFNPVSMPEGPRDSPGVRWQGVHGKTQEEPAQRSAKKLDR